MFHLLVAGASIWSSLLAVGTGSAQATPAASATPKAVVSSPAPAAAAAPVAPAPKTYTVASGDNLSAIAAAEGLESWRPLWNVNEALTDPNLIYAGQVLTVPAGPTTDRPVPQAAVATAAVLDQASAGYARTAAPKAAANYAAGSAGVFERIRQRESGGNYATNTGNGYYGAYQYDLGTWGNYAGYARPDLAPPAVQDAKAAETYAARGCSPWPNTCS